VIVYGILWAIGVDQPNQPRRRQLRYDLGVVALTGAGLVVVFVLMPSVPAQLLGPLGFVAFALAFSARSTVGADLVSGRAFSRIAVGLVLMFAGLFAGAAVLGDIGQVWVMGAAIAAVAAGVGVVLAPWLRELIDGASTDRIERVRAEERADIAAHLHDSVLQTLTLIQNRSHEPQIASSLAYQQERELRSWLYEHAADRGADTSAANALVRSKLAGVSAAVEDDYLVAIDLVCVGDATLSTPLNALIGAVREALINAAKFSETTSISAFVEVGAERAEAFVRDRGAGFDPEAVPADRRGIADSIIDRVARVGGAARIRSSPGDGTEVHIEVPIDS